MPETNVTVCTCLEVFGENPECPKHGTDALEARIRDLEALIAAQHGDVVSRTAKLLYEKDDIIASLRARLTASEAAREKLAGLLRDFLTAEYESPSYLFDCVDNHGTPYQSQWLADKIAEAEKLLANTSEAHHG